MNSEKADVGCSNQRTIPIVPLDVPFDRGKETTRDRQTRIQALFHELNSATTTTDGSRKITADSLQRIPKKFAFSVSDWERSQKGYLESKRFLSVFKIPTTLSFVTAWWEIALLSGARIPEVDPTVNPEKR